MANNLWQKDGVQKALVVLRLYRKEYAKCSFVGSGENYDGMPPNHQAVTDMNASARTEHVGAPDRYCMWCIDVVDRMVTHNNLPKHARILINTFFETGIKIKTDIEMANELNYNRQYYYDLIPKAVNEFYYTFIHRWPNRFSELYQKATLNRQ